MFDRGRAQQHVQGGLRGAVGGPAAETVVGDATDPGGQRCEQGPGLSPQQRQEVLGQQHGADRIDAKYLEHHVCVDASQALLRLDLAAVQQAAGYDDRIDRAVGGHCGGGGTNAVLVSEVAFEILDPGCGRSGRLPV